VVAENKNGLIGIDFVKRANLDFIRRHADRPIYSFCGKDVAWTGIKNDRVWVRAERVL